MRNDDAVVRLQQLSGTWEQIGTGAWRGYTPEGIQASSNVWGYDTLSFTLKRDPRRGGHNDLKAFTPVELEVAGQVVWEGYIWETPTQVSPTSLSISVSCRGWQYSLDDEQYAKCYVHSSLTDWVDNRSVPGVDLANWLQGASVSADDGNITFGFAKGDTIGVAKGVGVTLDLGPGQFAKAFNMNVTALAAASTITLYARGSDGVDNTLHFGPTGGVYEDVVAVPGASSGDYGGTFAGAWRFIHIFLYYNTTPEVAAAADLAYRINSAYVFTNNAYGGSPSNLTADQVLSDLVGNAAPLLSGSVERIAATTFKITDFDVSEPKTTREIIDAVNAYHAYRTKIVEDRKLLFQPQVSSAIIATKDSFGSEFTDASANVAEALFNRVVVSGTGPDGQPVRVTRSAQQSALATQLFAPASPTLGNATFDANITGWTNSNPLGGSGAWSWTGADGSPTAGAATLTTGSAGNTSGSALAKTFTGTFVAGQTYQLRFRYKITTAATDAGGIWGWPRAAFGAPADATAGYPSSNPNNVTLIVQGPTPGSGAMAWTEFIISWTPTVTTSSASFQILGASNLQAANAVQFLDNVVLFVSAPTLLDRWGRFRTATLSVSSPMNTALGLQLGDVFLSTKARTPFKGQWKLTGERSAWASGTESPMHPSQLLRYTTEMVRFMDLIDPDTGSIGRDGVLATVTYTHDDRSVTSDIDNTRTDFEALLARMATVTQSRGVY